MRRPGQEPAPTASGRQGSRASKGCRKARPNRPIGAAMAPFLRPTPEMSGRTSRCDFENYLTFREGGLRSEHANASPGQTPVGGLTTNNSESSTPNDCEIHSPAARKKACRAIRKIAPLVHAFPYRRHLETEGGWEEDRKRDEATRRPRPDDGGNRRAVGASRQRARPVNGPCAVPPLGRSVLLPRMPVFSIPDRRYQPGSAGLPAAGAPPP